MKKICIFLLLTVFGANLSMASDERFPKVSLKLSGGAGILNVGDINKVLKSLSDNQVLRNLRKDNPDNEPDRSHVEGYLKALRNTYTTWEAELRLDLSPRMGFSISTFSPIHRENRNSLTYTYVGLFGPEVTTWTYRPEFRVSSPLIFNFHYTLKSGARRTIFFNAGIGRYSGKMSVYLNYEQFYPAGGSYVEEIDCKTQAKSSLGFHAGVSLEYALLKNLALVIDMRGSFVTIRNFIGVMDWENNFGQKYSTIGYLYYFLMFDEFAGLGYRGLEVWERPPDFDVRSLSNIRKARLDLSGYSLRVGIKLGLF
jgi:hypothetical protein